MRQNLKNILLWLVIILIFMTIFKYLSRVTPAPEIPFSEFLNHLKKGEIVEVVIQGEEISGTLKNKKRFKTYAPEYPKLTEKLAQAGVTIRVKPADADAFWKNLLITWVPVLVIVFLWISFMRNMQMAGGKALSFVKSRAKLIDKDKQKVTFDDVAGIEEAKEELREIVDFLKDPKRFARLGAKIPKGVLLIGAPGTGKTLLARAIAGEAGVPFYSISGSDFVELFVGVGASRVRDLFEQAKKTAPCIVFIDEIDAVGRLRGAGLGGGHDEREQTLNQLLVEMDGIESNEGIIVIAATNRPDILDPALLRPGRFDRRVIVPKPDVKGREAILKVHARKIPLAEDVDLSVIARGTPGFSGADLANLVNEAALIAAREGRSKVEMQDFEEAKDKILMGRERRTMIISDEEKRVIAYHEAGHVIVAKSVEHSDPVHKVTIIPRGMSLGLTQQLPEEDRYTYTKEYLIDQITVLLGGRAAEELALKTLSTGASNDLERATDIARRMVCEWGMSETLGPMTLGRVEEHIFLGKELARQQNYSERTAIQVDNEIQKIIFNCYERAKSILSQKNFVLHNMASALIEREVLEAQDIDEIINSTGELKVRTQEAKEA